ncbi:MAG: 6-pyruvoyl-tetrahydropterin synthase-related protein, partial [Acidimicrobiales bacterium]
MRRPSLTAVVSTVTVAGAALFVLAQLQPGLIVANTTPAGGDMGAHVWGPAFLRDHVLPHLRLTGWTPDWYAGFPAYHFYFPLPNLVIVLLDVVMPYGVAFKLVAVSGIVGMPVAAWAFGRLSGLPFPTPELLALAVIPFVFDRFHTIWGGNAASTLAGEYSFSIALSLALVFLGVFAHSLETGRHSGTAAVLLAMTGLSHLLPTAFAVAGAGALVLLYRPSWARTRIAVAVGGIGFLLSACWVVPFLVRLPYSNDMGWERTNSYLEHLLPFLQSKADVAPELTRHLWVVAPLAVVGVVAALVRRRRGAIVIVILAAVNGIGFVVVPDGRIWNARLLPFWYLTLYLLAAIAIAELAIVVAEVIRGPEDEGDRAPRVVAVAVAAFAVFVAIGGPLQAVPSWLPISTTDRSFIPDWARWNFSGYERKTAYPEYADAVNTMTEVGRENGCGRAMWEYEPQLDRYGTPMALMLLPFWTDGCIGSMEGLYFESSATVPYHFLNQSELSQAPSRAMRDLPYRSLDLASGVAHLRLMGVRYYMAISPEAQAAARIEPGLFLVATTDTHFVNYPEKPDQPRAWEVYEVEDAPLVEPLEFRPVVVAGVDDREAWLAAAVDWYQDDTRWDVPIAAAGPSDWPRVDDPAATGRRVPVRTARVSDIKTDDDDIRFSVDQIGVPVVVKVSYFPNWKANGADGPYRVSPNFMVVIPTAEQVTLHYGWTFVDILAWLMTLAGLVLLAVVARFGAVAVPQPPPLAEPY